MLVSHDTLTRSHSHTHATTEQACKWSIHRQKPGHWYIREAVTERSTDENSFKLLCLGNRKTDNCVLLPCYAAGTGNSLQMFRSNLSVPSSSFLKMEPISCPETSVRNCHHPLGNKAEERSSSTSRRKPEISQEENRSKITNELS